MLTKWDTDTQSFVQQLTLIFHWLQLNPQVLKVKKTDKILTLQSG